MFPSKFQFQTFKSLSMYIPIPIFADSGSLAVELNTENLSAPQLRSEMQNYIDNDKGDK